ncbi:MAG: hypothetical protein ACSHXK_14390 [Oceanococcus sp.]
MKKLAGIILGIAIAPAHADIITLPGGPANERPTDPQVLEQPSDIDRSGLPRRGMLKEQVRAQYGEPVAMNAAVGDPPISRWTYDDFVVFFEYKHVINAVVPNKPRKIFNQEELRPGWVER